MLDRFTPLHCLALICRARTLGYRSHCAGGAAVSDLAAALPQACLESIPAGADARGIAADDHIVCSRWHDALGA